MNTLHRSLHRFEHMPIREAHLLLKSFEFARKISCFNLRPFEPFWTFAWVLASCCQRLRCQIDRFLDLGGTSRHLFDLSSFISSAH